VKRYKFQALVTLGPPQDGGPAAMPGGQMRRLVLRGQRHGSGGSHFFSALVTKSNEPALWPDDNPVIMTIAVVGDDLREYFDVGDRFALWQGTDLGRGVVTRRIFV